MLISILVFIMVVLVVMGIGPVVASRFVVRKRLPLTAGGIQDPMHGSLRQHHIRTFWTRLVTTLETNGIALTDSNPLGLRKIGRAHV